MTNSRMTATEFAIVRRLVGLSAQQLAERFAVNLRSVQRWESGERPIGESIADEMRDLAILHAHDTADMLRSSGRPEPLTLPAPTADKPSGWWLAVAAGVMAQNPDARFD